MDKYGAKMQLINKLKQYEKQIVYLRWGSESNYGKLNYVGYDFVEFHVLDADEMEYTETVIINAQMVLEMVVGGTDIHRIVAEMSRRLPSAKEQP